MSPPQPATADQLRQLVQRADPGDKGALAEVRRLMDEQLPMVDHFGNLAKVAAELWLSLLSGGNTLVAEATRRRMVHHIPLSRM
jgi:hypothetical protein